MDKRYESFARLGAVLLLTIGCLYVLRPFLAAILFAAVVTISSWPLYQRLLARLKGRNNLAALSMTLSLTLVIVLPVSLLAYNLADDVARIFEQIKSTVDGGAFTVPAWLRELPLVGEAIDKYLHRVFGSREEMLALAQRLMEPARHYLLAGGLVLGSGVIQVSLAAFVSFFLYRDGPEIVAALRVMLERLIGDAAAKVTQIVSNTVTGVMFGMLGTALAQALVAALGFAIAGVPAVPLLSAATFFFSLIPIGPPLIWGGAAAWLFMQDQTGWAIFMLIWGTVLISGVDNVVKPFLISRGSSLPFLLVLLGVTGGVFAFGFVGLFIGPSLLAVAYSLLKDWSSVQ
jgi:predicted PurR-regulated permease PerM